MLNKEQKEQIIKMRKQGFGFKAIEKTLGLKTSQAKGFGKSKYFKYNYPELSGFIKQQGNPLDNRTIKRRVEDKYPTFEYIGGYKNCESYITIKCKICKENKEINAQILRKNKVVECRGCIKINKSIERNKLIEAKRLRERIKEEIRSKKIKKQIIEKTKQCQYCGENFISSNKKRTACSDVCRKKINNRRGELRKKKLYSNGKIDKDLNLSSLSRRDRDRCKICGKKVDWKDFKEVENSFIVGKLYPSIDHIKPVSKGGTHTWDNVQLAHMYCNTTKSDRDIYETTHGQLMFAI